MISAYSDGPVSQLFGPVILFFGRPVMGKLLVGGESLGSVCKLGPYDGCCV